LGWEFVGTTKIRFGFEAGGWEWVALGFQQGVSRMTGDAVIIQAADSSINAYTLTYQNEPVLKTSVYFTNASVIKVGNSLTGDFTRTIAAPKPGDIAITPSALKFMWAVSASPFPSAHANSDRIAEQIDLTLTEAPTLPGLTSVPTHQPSSPAPTLQPSSPAPTTAALSTTLTGYAHSMSVMGGKVKFAWSIVNDVNVKFGFEATGAQWVGLGFQDPSASAKMTGDVAIVQGMGSIGTYLVQYQLDPTVKTGNYFIAATAGKTGNLLHGEFTRSLAAPLPGTVNISDPSRVRIMLAYCTTTYPNQHTDRIEVTVNLNPSTSVVEVSGSYVFPYFQTLILSAFCAFWC
jgi:hypothetical protein